MSAYYAFRFLWSMVVISLVLGTVFVFFAIRTASGISNEISYRHQYGADWQGPFEKRFGRVEKFRTGTVASGIGVIAMPSLGFWIYTLLRKTPRRGGNRKKSQERRMGNTERTMHARSRALLWNYLGLLGILVGALLVLFRWHIFADHANESVLGMFIFCAGYCSVVAGCWWWLRAKAWSEAVVVIAVWPLMLMFIPFVRILFVRLLAIASPLLLLVGLLLLPAMLLVVVAVLPDKSGVNKKQRRAMNWKDIQQKQQP